MEKIVIIDKLDREILSILIKDAKIPYTEIAKRLIVSPGTIHVRLKKMERLGIIQGTGLIIDSSKLGFDITAFIGIYLENGSLYNNVIKVLSKVPEVIEAHYTTGQYSIFAKIICKNTKQLRDVINDSIQGIQGVMRTETILSLEESIHKSIPVMKE